MAALAPRPKVTLSTDPLRDALGGSIAKLREAKDKSRAAHAAAKRAADNVETAKARIEAANAAVQEARDHYALVLIKAATDDREAPSDKTLRAARTEAEIADDDLAAAEQAAQTLIAACADPDIALQRAEQDVSDAADAVIAERAPDILAEGDALARSLADKIIPQLQFLADVLSRVAQAKQLKIIAASADTSQALAALNAPDPQDALAKEIEYFVALHSRIGISDQRSAAELEDWHRALEALKCDADAALP